MSEKAKQEEPDPLDDDSSDDDFTQFEIRDQNSTSNATITESPSILRPINTPRPDISNGPSVVISLPSNDTFIVTDETPEQRLRRRMRFLELRREHYNHIIHSEQCDMSDTEDDAEDHAEKHAKCQENCKPK
ncbi:uncharacterized protein LOC6542733 [Drosophila erecta]|uniref:Uncharacterized protein n=1 Tax=Drosophila erecta TaxID=7220 RepID=B3N4Z1_DROER|nr:uncharacterized protein LOC6542733 [Drosophila erecta]EDV58936.1 uncharacterized protein Dere_GG23697 [Drosophila erecta]